MGWAGLGWAVMCCVVSKNIAAVLTAILWCRRAAQELG